MKELDDLKNRLIEHKNVANHPAMTSRLNDAINGIDDANDISTRLRDKAFNCINTIIDIWKRTKNIEQKREVLESIIITGRSDLENQVENVDRKIEPTKYADLQYQRLEVGNDLNQLNMIMFVEKISYVALSAAPTIITAYILFDDNYFKLLLPEKQQIIPDYVDRLPGVIKPLIGNIPGIGNIISVIDSFNNMIGKDELKITKDASKTMTTLDKINIILPEWVNNSSNYENNIEQVYKALNEQIKEIESSESKLSILEDKYL